jgi:hypothetical protein
MKFLVVDDAELTAMSDKEGSEHRTEYIHLHICIHCGHPRGREQVEVLEVSSGILHCPKCGVDGPLNIDIREIPTA